MLGEPKMDLKEDRHAKGPKDGPKERENHSSRERVR